MQHKGKRSEIKKEKRKQIFKEKKRRGRDYVLYLSQRIAICSFVSLASTRRLITWTVFRLRPGQDRWRKRRRPSRRRQLNLSIKHTGPLAVFFRTRNARKSNERKAQSPQRYFFPSRPSFLRVPHDDGAHTPTFTIIFSRQI